MELIPSLYMIYLPKLYFCAIETFRIQDAFTGMHVDMRGYCLIYSEELSGFK